MKKKYTKKEFTLLSNKGLLEITKGKAVDFHFFNKQPSQLGRNDLQGYNTERGYYIDSILSKYVRIS